MGRKNIEQRLANLEAATPVKPVRYVVVREDGVDPLPAYLAAHPDAAAKYDLRVVDTGIRRGEGEY